MNNWIRRLEAAVLVGILAFLVIGLLSWFTQPPLQAVVVTREVTATPRLGTVDEIQPPSPTPTMRTAADVPATWTPTLTPTYPAPTVTSTPSATPTPTAPPVRHAGYTPLPALSVTPVISSSIGQPPMMPLVAQPKDTINVLLLGSDRREGEGWARTDVIVIVSIFPGDGAVSMLSVPRDYYAWIPGWGLDKINTAHSRATRVGYPGGGVALIKDTIQYNFGIPIHYYAMVDFGGFSDIVDAVGGVDIIVECPFHDTYPDEDSETGQTDIDLAVGPTHLEGKFALWYVRSRWNTSDYDRHRRQQQVLRAILSRAISQNMLANVPELWSAYQDYVETDMGLTDMLSFIPLALKIENTTIRQSYIRGSDLIEPWTAPNGGYVLVPRLEAMTEFVLRAASPPSSSRASQRAYVVEVVNGTGNSGWGEVAVYRLGLEGLLVTSVTDGAWAARTTVTDYTTTSKGSPLYVLNRLYGLQPGDVVAEPTEGSPVDFRVYLGANYNPCAGTGTAYWRPTPTP